MFRLLHEEKGSAMVLFGIGLVVFLGIAALVLDGGALYMTKSQLQNAADAAALAGAIDLPYVDDAEETAVIFAGKNGVLESETIPTAPYNGKYSQIEVICTRTVPLTFARVLGHTQSEVKARAVAQKISIWAGESLPFINTTEDYKTAPFGVMWIMCGPGDYGSLWKDEYEIINPDDPDKLYFQVDFENGATLTKGVVATVKQEVGYVYDQLEASGRNAYVLSLSSDVIKSGKVRLADGSTISISSLKNKDTIAKDQLVLLECSFDAYDFNVKNRIDLTYYKSWDIGHGEMPEDYINPDEGTSKLIL